MTNSSEIAELVVKTTEYDTSRTKFYIDEFAALLEKYNSAIVVHDTKEKMAAEKVATLKKQVSPKRNALYFQRLMFVRLYAAPLVFCLAELGQQPHHTSVRSDEWR